jgi:hypothetical protein
MIPVRAFSKIWFYPKNSAMLPVILNVAGSLTGPYSEAHIVQ